jgi:hypothetical protein
MKSTTKVLSMAMLLGIAGGTMLTHSGCQEPDNWVILPDSIGETVTFDAIYLVGSATPADWAVENSVELTKEDDHNFTWTGVLIEGEFKFPIEEKDWGAQFFLAGGGDSKDMELGKGMPLRYSESGDGGNDHKFKVSAAQGGKTYKLHLKIRSLTNAQLTVTEVP